MTTHMTSFGCFGSILAFNNERETCGNCPHKDECAAEVAQKRPKFLIDLSRFTASNGETKAYKWLTKIEKATLREVRRVKAIRLASQQVYGDIDFIQNLKAKTGERVHPLIDKSIAARVNLLTATPKQMSGFDKNLGFIFANIEVWPRTHKYLIGQLEKFASLKEATAKRTTYTATALLEACDRIQNNNGILEIK